MVQYASNPQHPLLRTAQIGPHRWLVVDRFGCIRVEAINAQGLKTYISPEFDDLAAARQLTWWRSPANPLRQVQGVRRADGVVVRGSVTYCTGGRWWVMIEVMTANRKHLPPVAIPRDADAAAYVKALLTVAASPSTQDRLPASWLV